MTTLREQCKQRLKVAFDCIRAISGSLTFILVVDESALKVISSTIKMMQLINYGINSIERLTLKRKKFSKIEAVYMIHPDSFNDLIADYEDEPQYGSIHVLMLTKIPPNVMNELSQNEAIVKRIKTLKQLNFSFVLNSDNEFLIQKAGKNYSTTSIMSQGTQYQTCISTTVELLSTVVTSMSQFYIVQILYSAPSVSNMAQKISIQLKDKLQKMFDIYGKYKVQNYTNNAPQTTFLILDRCYDAVTPLLRDFHYLPLLYDTKNAHKHKITLQTKTKEKKVYTLDQKQPIFDKYKYQHISKTIAGIQQDFQLFSRDHIGAKVQKSSQQSMGLDKMSEVMKKLPQYNQLKEKYSFHMTMVSNIMTNYDQNKYRLTGELQQNLVCQISENGKNLKPGDLVGEVLKVVEQLQSEAERARILLITLLTLQIKPKEKEVLVEQLRACKSYSEIYKNMQKLSGPLLYKMGPKKNGKQELILDRHIPRIEDTVRKISEGGQADLKYLRVGTEVRGKSSAQKNTVATLGRRKIGTAVDKVVKPRLIVFFCTAISYSEIRALAAYEKDFQIIYGSHSFTTQSQFIELLNELQAEQL